MPIYEYECTDCHHKFDLLQKLSDISTTQCPECFKETAIRLVSAAGFQLKGTGWYATDFKDKGKPPQKSEGEASQSTSTDAKTTDTKTTETKASESTATPTPTAAVSKKGETD